MILRSLITVLALAGVSVPAATARGPCPRKPAASRQVASDKFAIYTSTLAGNTQTLIASDPTREINHAHISPDGSHLAFTRYNTYNNAGLALETNGYLQTEIVVCAANGSNCVDAIPSRPGIIAANASWTPDGQHLLFLTNATPTGLTGISIYDLATKSVTPFFQPSALKVADPVFAGSKMVVSSIARGSMINQIFLASSAGLNALTSPTFANPTVMNPPLGDFDPKLSPNGTMVALMRHIAPGNYAIVMVNVATKAESYLSPPNPIDAVPEWSSDGRLLIFWHVDTANLILTGLYTMLPDGSQRTRLPLPFGYFYSMAAFFPGGGSLPSSQIIYSAQRWN
jgi:Tol biopolymer transport system component